LYSQWAQITVFHSFTMRHGENSAFVVCMGPSTSDRANTTSKHVVVLL